ncbi:hypothetical protein DFR52_10612 [Hoeflea marina]|uniref:Beta-lactamase-related domain-containing protein n=1 Tax=Hoeflea marina TaxID=274592 RepID=A0A317PD72_9HYPH|nr:serine hydrolase [Hoeflea marina]PWV97489.1 hypothetical protein DFR52_10612 [Hoeflea marina]
MDNEFATRNGYPRSAVTLANWRTQPFNRWAFRNVAELVPSARISTASPSLLPDPVSNPAMLGRTAFEGSEEKLAWFLATSQTDSFLVARDGRIICEWHAAGVDRQDPHLLFSITKSITALVTAILEEQGFVDLSAPIGAILPETRRGAYGDATVRQLLDMRVSLDFEEVYNSDGDYARYRRAMLWNPADPKQEDPGLFALLCALPKGAHAHGGVHAYQSPNTDMLGTALEELAGRRFSDLCSALLWHPLGASADAMLTVDRFGAPRTAGGMSCRPHDLLAVGQMLLDGGKVGDQQIIPPAWLDDMRSNGDEEVWAKGSQADFLAHGRYRSCWYQVGGASQAYLAAGIHGQYLYVDPESRTVIAKFASQDEPQDSLLDRQNLALFASLCAAD